MKDLLRVNSYTEEMNVNISVIQYKGNNDKNYFDYRKILKDIKMKGFKNIVLSVPTERIVNIFRQVCNSIAVCLITFTRVCVSGR